MVFFSIDAYLKWMNLITLCQTMKRDHLGDVKVTSYCLCGCGLQVLAHWRYSKQMSWGQVLNNWLIKMWVFEKCLVQWKQLQFVSKQTLFFLSLIGCKQDILYILVTLFLFENKKK
jgi:hypothetical protein